MLSTSQIGAFGEYHFAARCIELGINVAFPAVHDCRYDVITEYNGLFYRIQVKSKQLSAQSKRSSNLWTLSHKAAYSEGEVDFFAFFLIDEKTYMIIPSNEIEGKQKLRTTPGGKYDQYHEAFHLLKGG